MMRMAGRGISAAWSVSSGRCRTSSGRRAARSKKHNKFCASDHRRRTPRRLVFLYREKPTDQVGFGSAYFPVMGFRTGGRNVWGFEVYFARSKIRYISAGTRCCSSLGRRGGSCIFCFIVSPRHQHVSRCEVRCTQKTLRTKTTGAVSPPLRLKPCEARDMIGNRSVYPHARSLCG